jgi:hypothetical protein
MKYCDNMKHVKIPQNCKSSFSGCSRLAVHFRNVFLPSCPDSVSNILVVELAFVLVTRCHQSSCTCPRSLKSNCKQIVEQISLSSLVSAWRIQRQILRATETISNRSHRPTFWGYRLRKSESESHDSRLVQEWIGSNFAKRHVVSLIIGWPTHPWASRPRNGARQRL